MIASTAYALRFARWHLTLRAMGSHVRPGINFVVYLSGLALTTSPGKLGETVRSAFLLPMGVPVSRSLGAFLADRLADVLGVCLLGAVAGFLVRGSLNLVGIALGAVLTGSFICCGLVRRPRLFARAMAFAGRWGFTPGRVAVEAVGHWACIWTLPRAAAFTLIAAVAYGIQALVFASLCAALSVALPPAVALEIFVNATLFGAASMVPGGLGAMEASLVFQLMNHGADKADAVAIAIAIRCATLWCGVLIGLISLGGVCARMKSGAETSSP